MSVSSNNSINQNGAERKLDNRREITHKRRKKFPHINLKKIKPFRFLQKLGNKKNANADVRGANSSNRLGKRLDKTKTGAPITIVEGHKGNRFISKNSVSDLLGL